MDPFDIGDYLYTNGDPYNECRYEPYTAPETFNYIRITNNGQLRSTNNDNVRITNE